MRVRVFFESLTFSLCWVSRSISISNDHCYQRGDIHVFSCRFRVVFFTFSSLSLRVYFASNHFAPRNIIGRTRIGNALWGLGRPGRTRPTTRIENYKRKKSVRFYIVLQSQAWQGQVAHHMSVRRKRFINGRLAPDTWRHSRERNLAAHPIGTNPSPDASKFTFPGHRD